MGSTLEILYIKVHDTQRALKHAVRSSMWQMPQPLTRSPSSAAPDQHLHLLHLFSTFLIIKITPVRPLYSGGKPMLVCFGILADSRTITPRFSLLMLDISQRTLRKDGVFILEDKDVLVLSEKPINIFESTV